MEAELRFALEALGGEVIIPPDNPRRILRGFTWDSREVVPDGMFLAMPGEHVDGNAFVRSAVLSGAALVAMTGEADPGDLAMAGEFDCSIVRVGDPQAALRSLAREYRSTLSATVIGITGSSGKTTTKDIVASVLSQGMSTTATRANFNNEIGVPATILAANHDTQALIVEMGMRGLGQIADLCTYVSPRIGIVTNIGVSHMELLGSQENIARAKGELLAALPREGAAIVNGDDPLTSFMLAQARPDPSVRIIRFGLGENCDVRAMDVSISDEGRPSFDVMFRGWGVRHVSLCLQGSHNVMNALAAAAVGYALSMTPAAIAEGLILAQPGSMRFQMEHTRSGATIIDDAYNANPDSMRAALSTLQGMEVAGRRIAVLGDMSELWDASVTYHREKRSTAHARPDLLICVGTSAADIALRAVDGGMPE